MKFKRILNRILIISMVLSSFALLGSLSIGTTAFAEPRTLINVDEMDFFGKVASQSGSVFFNIFAGNPIGKGSTITPTYKVGSLYDQVEIKQLATAMWQDRIELSKPETFSTSGKIMIEARFKIKMDDYEVHNMPTNELRLYIPNIIGWDLGMPSTIIEQADENTWRTVQFVIDPKAKTTTCTYNNGTTTTTDSRDFLLPSLVGASFDNVKLFLRSVAPGVTPADDGKVELSTAVTWTFDYIKVSQEGGVPFSSSSYTLKNMNITDLLGNIITPTNEQQSAIVNVDVTGKDIYTTNGNLIFARYDVNNILQEVGSIEFSLNSGETTTLHKNFMLQHDDKIKAFVWDNSSNTQPLTDSIEYKVGDWNLVWGDEFNGTSIDKNTWNYELGYVRNNELQYYSDRQENARVENGNLVIEARKESNIYPGYNYTSASLNTQRKKSFLYGKIEMRAKLPYGKGVWPAFWTMGDNYDWPNCGEIDIMELIGGGVNDATAHGTIHWFDGGHQAKGSSTKLESGSFSDQYHIFGIEWDASEIRWYIDREQVFTADITNAEMSEFHQKHWILLDFAVGGNWPGSPDDTTVFPQKYQVDWVRVYQKEN